MVDWKLVAGLLVVVWAVNRVLAYFKKLSYVGTFRGLRFPVSPMSLPGSALPTTSWNGGMLFTWKNRHTRASFVLLPYLYKDQDTISVVPYLLGPAMLYTSSVETSKQVLAGKASWDKLAISVDSLAAFGENVFSTYWDRWPRHRKIVAPGFNQRLYASVWSESIRTYHNMIQTENWADQNSFVMEDVIAVTSKIALFLIAACGFGIPLEWNEGVGDRIRGMTLQECFGVVGSSIIIRILLPKWAFRLPVTHFRKVVDAHDILESILKGIIMRRRLEGPSGIGEDNEKDVFSLLLKANDEEKDSKTVLTDQELVSNVFLLMLAGHETTSRSLAATLGLLACYPEEQKNAYQEITSIVKDGEDPTFKDYDTLPYLTSCFLEAMRLYPSISQTGRRTTCDTSVTMQTKEATKVEIPLKEGTIIILDFIGACYNPQYYPSPTSFIPSRWLSPTIEPLINFSYGPRICIGKKFAMVEGVAILGLMLRDWKLEMILKEGETATQWRKRVLDDSAIATLGFGPGPFPLRFVRREKTTVT